MNITWHPYPQTHPESVCSIQWPFLVTIKDDHHCYVTIETWHIDSFDDDRGDIIAWAELPEPYEQSIET